MSISTNNLAAALTDRLNSALVPTEDPETFRIDSLPRALWAIRRLQQHHRQVAEVRAVADAQRAAIDAWVLQTSDEAAQAISRLEELLRPWVLQELTGSSKKSLKLLNATLGFRSQSDVLEYDDATMVTWAREHEPEWVRTKYELEKAKIREAVVKEGQVVRDAEDHLLITVQSRPDTFYCKIAEPTAEKGV